MEEVLSEIINSYGKELWISFVTLVVTGFALTLIKSLIQDLVYYIKARMSDIGTGQRIYFSGQIYEVRKITFRDIVARDDRMTIFIPIGKYINGVREYPRTRYDDFDETKYHEKPWDGVTERRNVKKE